MQYVAESARKYQHTTQVSMSPCQILPHLPKKKNGSVTGAKNREVDKMHNQAVA